MLEIIRSLMDKTPRSKARLLTFCAAVSGESATVLSELRIKDIESLVRAQGFDPGFEGELLKIAQKEIGERDSNELVIRGRNAKGKIPVTRMTIWRYLSPVFKGSEKARGQVLTAFRRILHGFHQKLGTLSHKLEELSQSIQRATKLSSYLENWNLIRSRPKLDFALLGL